MRDRTCALSSTESTLRAASLAGPSLNGLLADARIAQNEARNLMGTLGQVAPADRPAVRAEMRALYAKAAELRERAEGADAPSAVASVCPECGATYEGDNHTCSGLSPEGQAVLHDLTARLGLAAATADGIAEYEAWAGGVAA